MLTLIKAYGGWAALVAALGLAFGLYRSEIAKAEARGQAELMATQADSAFRALEDSSTAWAARKAAADSAIQSLRSDLDRQRGLAKVAQNAASQAVLDARQVIAALSDSLATLTQADLDAIGAGLDSLEDANRLCNQALGSCEHLVQAADARIWDLESQFRQVDALAHQQAVVIDRLQNLRKPSVGWLGYLGWGAAVAIAVVAVVH